MVRGHSLDDCCREATSAACNGGARAAHEEVGAAQGLPIVGVSTPVYPAALAASPGGGLLPAVENLEAEMPARWMEQVIPYSELEEIGLDEAPFIVQATAPMYLVHFYFSQLTLNCVFVVDKGHFVGTINKADMREMM